MNKNQDDSNCFQWVIVGVSTLTMFGFYGAYLSFGVFFTPLINEFGWTRATLSGALTITLCVSGLLGTILGHITDRYGARFLVLIGSIMGGIGYILMSGVNTIWQLYLYFGLFTGVSIAACYNPLIAVVSKWVSKKRVMAIGITTSGLTLGHMILPPIIAIIINCYGWPRAYLLLAFLVWLSPIPAIIFLRKRPPVQEIRYISKDHVKNREMHEIKQQAINELSGREALKTLSFWILMITGFAMASGFFFMSVHVVAYANDRGIPPTLSALILTLMNCGSLGGKFSVSNIAGMLGGRFSLILLIGIQGISLFLLQWAIPFWSFLILGSCFGFGFGAASTIRMSMVSELFGIKSVGTIVGFIGVAWALGAFIGPILAGYVYDITHSYSMAFSVGGLIMVVGMFAANFLGRDIRK